MKSTPTVLLLLLLLLLLVDARGSITALPPCVLPEAPQHRHRQHEYGSTVVNDGDFSSPTAKEERFSFIPASSPSAWYTGRTKINSDGSRSFDWEGTQMWINITGASYVKVVINVTDNVVGMSTVHTLLVWSIEYKRRNSMLNVQYMPCLRAVVPVHVCI